MTAQQLFDMTVGLMGMTTANAESYLETAIHQINVILAQTFKLENNNREYQNLTLVTPLPLLTTIPTVAAMSDSLTYQENIQRNVLPFGLAQLFAVSDRDYTLASFYETRYGDAIALESKYIESEVVDAYDVDTDEVA